MKKVSSHIKEGILIFIGAGALLSLLFTIRGFSGEDIAYVAGFNATMWLLMWKGNEIIVDIIDRRISWIKTPGKRLGIGILAMLVYVTLAAIFVNLLFYLFLENKPDITGVYNSVIDSTVVSVIITVFIMLSIYSYSFLKSWRQAAINVEKLKKESIASQYEILKNQVNPHFLFNTLNALTSLIYEDQDKAVTFINKFSEVYRYVLDSRDKEVVPLKAEIDFVRSFIYLLQTRYEENLRVTFTVKNDEGYIPPMALQLIVENAIKHNIISDDNPLEIKIQMNKDEIRVTNNMTEKKSSSDKGGIGLENIRSRYEMLSKKPVVVNDDQHAFSVTLPVLQMENS